MISRTLTLAAVLAGLFSTSLAQNVGIGTTSPLQKITVQYAGGLWSAFENQGHGISTQTGTGSTDYILYMGADKTNDLSYIQSVHYGTAVASLGLNERGGNVGIGTGTSGTYYAPTNTLSINGSGGMWNYNQFNFYADNGITPRGFIGNYGGGSDFALSSVSTGNWMRIGCNNGAIAFFPDGTLTTGNLPKVMISSAGYIGVGTNNPGYPIDVESTIGQSFGSIGYLNNTGTTSYGNSSSQPYSIFSLGRIAAMEFDAFSDMRIKKDRNLCDSKTDLQILLNLKPVEFRYIDSNSYGNDFKKGFIAQEVMDVFPEAVHINPGYTPSVYQMSIKTLYNDDSKELYVKVTKPHGLKVGDKVKIVTDISTSVNYVVKVISETEFSINAWKDGSANKVFVYGKEVTDLHTVDYDRIFTLNVSATQELASEFFKLQKKNDEIETKNMQLEAEINELKSIKSVSSDLEQIKAQIALLNSLVLPTSNK